MSSSSAFFAPQQLLSSTRGHPKKPLMNPMMKTNKIKETKPNRNFFCTDIPINGVVVKPPAQSNQLHISHYVLFSLIWKFLFKVSPVSTQRSGICKHAGWHSMLQLPWSCWILLADLKLFDYIAPSYRAELSYSLKYDIFVGRAS